MSAPKISVALGTYNASAFIQETISSVLRQDVDFELIVLDDGSTDNTVSLIREFGDARMRIYTHERNEGRIANMNRAFSLARGEYVARIDHDDIALPNRFARQSQFLDQNSDITAVGSQIQHFQLSNYTSDFPLNDAAIKARFLVGAAYFANQSSMFRKAIVDRCNLRYDANLYIVDDLGFWYDCLLSGAQFANLPDVLTMYREHESMTSMNLDWNLLAAARRRLYSRLLPSYFPELNGHDVQKMLPLYGEVADMSNEPFVAAHEAVGKAMHTSVNTQWGLDAQLTRESLVCLLNMRRAAWMERHGDGATAAAFDDAFYKASLAA